MYPTHVSELALLHPGQDLDYETDPGVERRGSLPSFVLRLEFWNENGKLNFEMYVQLKDPVEWPVMGPSPCCVRLSRAWVAALAKAPRTSR